MLKNQSVETFGPDAGLMAPVNDPKVRVPQARRLFLTL